jgi:hypothetical protein
MVRAGVAMARAISNLALPYGAALLHLLLIFISGGKVIFLAPRREEGEKEGRRAFAEYLFRVWGERTRAREKDDEPNFSPQKKIRSQCWSYGS